MFSIYVSDFPIFLPKFLRPLIYPSLLKLPFQHAIVVTVFPVKFSLIFSKIFPLSSQSQCVCGI